MAFPFQHSGSLVHSCVFAVVYSPSKPHFLMHTVTMCTTSVSHFRWPLPCTATFYTAHTSNTSRANLHLCVYLCNSTITICTPSPKNLHLACTYASTCSHDSHAELCVLCSGLFCVTTSAESNRSSFVLLKEVKPLLHPRACFSMIFHWSVLFFRFSLLSRFLDKHRLAVQLS